MIGPYFFENAAAGVRYRDVITNVLWNQLNCMDLEDIFKNFVNRVNVCKQGRGGHSSDVAFHTEPPGLYIIIK